MIRPSRTYREVTAWGYDYGTDAIELIADLFRPETATGQRPAARRAS